MTTQRFSASRKKAAENRVAIVRLEQFYPYPMKRMRELIGSYEQAEQIVWLQEEPKNMGAWTFVEPRLEQLINKCDRPIYVGRSASASPATGSYAIHQKEQAQLIAEALTV